ncbi:ABC transporter [Nocardiopsis terrae]|uniref:ABC-2 type transport system ATP-binding protein n=1 Tax=Nocardiopsis terrae TaxID=372655 RepID=A0ABR9HAB8_9ACTN|nr:ATP-binding cassette domain-containing protein [Nocardiopsis terrae]MBE1455974.1 ABC-2 type transport system ATP-binding protein [Nocardiopsis terrae]GHC96425.1 ABC transporter [Nocardiopsis terrae]
MSGVELDGVTLRDQDATILDRISLRLESGRVHGVLGPSGAGKSSLLSLIAGFSPATCGTVRVGGRPLGVGGVIITEQVGLVRGHLVPDPASRVEDTLAFTASLRSHWCDQVALRLLDRFRIPLGAPLSRLSQGELSAVGTVLGLAARTPVTLLDECCTGMDARMRDVFLDELLADLMVYPRTVVIATQLIQEVGPLFDDVVVLDRGRVLLHERVGDLQSHGTCVTGAVEQVDDLVRGLPQLDERELGPAKSVVVYGPLSEERLALARELGLDLSPIGLPELMAHLVEDTHGPR